MGESNRKHPSKQQHNQANTNSLKSSSSRKKVIMGIIIALIVLAALTTLFMLKDSTNMKFSDLAQVEAGETPEDFDVDNQPILGDPKAPIQIVEFSDYKCPYCKLWADEVFPPLKTEYIDTGKANFVYVDMAFLAPDSVLAALAGETLYQMNPDYFWKYHQLMTEQQGDKHEEWATYSFITNLVKKEMPEVPLEQFKTELKSEKYIKNIKRDLDIAAKQNVNGTPTIFVNGVKFEEPSFEEIKSFIDEQEAK